MKQITHNEQAFGSFNTFVNAVFTFDVKRMGIRAILLVLARLARAAGKSKQLGLEDTLESFDCLTRIHQKAMTGDSLAYSELFALTTLGVMMLNDATNAHPKLASEFARASLTWPILLPCYETAKEDQPQNRLKAFGFGEQAKAMQLRTFGHNLATMALLLHAFRVLRSVEDGSAKQVLQEAAKQQHTAKAWESFAKPNLNGSLGKLSNLPFPEVENIRAYRCVKTNGAPADVSSEVRYKIKTWFSRLHPLVRTWLALGKRQKKKS